MARSLQIEVKQRDALPGKKGCAETMAVQTHFLETVEKKKNKKKFCLSIKIIRQAVEEGHIS